MARGQRVVLHGHTTGQVDTVRRLVSDATVWAQWGKPLIWRSGWEHEGTPEPGAPGAVRLLGVPPMTLLEEILESSADRQQYTIVSPRMFSYYRGNIEWARGAAGGTQVSWIIDYTLRVPFVGRLLKPAMNWGMGLLLKRLLRAAAADALR